MEQRDVDIYALCNWSEFKVVQNELAYYTIRTSRVTIDFLNAWGIPFQKDQLKKKGVTLIKRSDGTLECVWKVGISSTLYEKMLNDTKESRATDSSLIIPKPDGLDYLPYQKAGIEFAVNRNNVLIADEPGLGKTIQAIGTINYLNSTLKKILIISPAGLKINWKREFEKWLVKPKKIQILNTIPNRLKGCKNHGYDLNTDADIIIINYDILKNFKDKLKSIKWDMVIIDEAQLIKNRLANRTKIATSIKAKRKLILTGTPIENRPMELFSLLHYLDKDMWNDHIEFGKRYCSGIETVYGWDFTGARRLDELQYKLRKTLMIRRKKADVLKDLPPKFRQVIELPSDGVEHVINREFDLVKNQKSIKDILKQSDKGSLSINDEEYAKRVDELKGSSDYGFEEIAEARYNTAMAKIPLVVEHLRNCFEEDSEKKIIVFAFHRDVIHELMKCCVEWNPVKLIGGMSSEEKQDSVDLFQNEPSCRLFIGNVKAAGVGITLTKSSHVIFVELDWVPGVITQCEDRSHRIGQKNNVLIQHLVFENSIDSKLIRNIIDKQKIIDSALDKDHYSAIKEE